MRVSEGITCGVTLRYSSWIKTHPQFLPVFSGWIDDCFMDDHPLFSRPSILWLMLIDHLIFVDPVSFFLLPAMAPVSLPHDLHPGSHEFCERD